MRFLAGGLLSLLVMGLGLRLIEATPLWRVLPVVKPIHGQPDKDMGYDFTPGASGVWPEEHRARVRINSLGLRDVERAPVKPAGTVRIGLMGDSFVEAMQVSQAATFGSLAERSLRAAGHKVELINLGISGRGVYRQLVRLEKHGYPLGLDAVVAIDAAPVFLTDILLDDSQEPAYVAAPDGSLVPGYAFRQRFSQRHASDAIGRTFVFVYQHAPLLRMLYLRATDPWSQLLGLSSAEARPARRPATGTENQTVCGDAAFADHLELWRDHKPAHRWAATTRYLDDFAASTKAHGVRAIYALRDIPFAPRGCPEAIARRRELIDLITREFTRRGVRFVDWSSAVADVAGGPAKLGPLRGFGLSRDTGQGHLNYAGHRAWAAALVNLLSPELPKVTSAGGS